jgi:glycosyltransferase involved in cell wall biosynthesis
LNPSLLFIKHKDFNARTVDNDLNILKDNYDITLKNINTTKGIGFITSLVSQLLYLLFFIHKFKIVFIWFADYHSFLPVFFAKLFGKICILNIGGYDADEILISEPLTLKSKFRKFCVKYSVKNTTKLLPVSDVIKKYLVQEVPESRCITVYCCVDTKLFKNENYEKENLIITVGGGGKFIKEADRKRLDFFIEVGNEFNSEYPEYDAKFYLIGHNKDSETYKYLFPLIKSPNIELKPITGSSDELNEYYRKASIYMQLSYYESFGIAQIEAMFNGCIPVSNNGGAIAEVVGDAGFIIKDFDKDKYIQTIKEILDKNHENMRDKAKNRVFQNFTLEKRKEKLNKIISALLLK